MNKSLKAGLFSLISIILVCWIVYLIGLQIVRSNFGNEQVITTSTQTPNLINPEAEVVAPGRIAFTTSDGQLNFELPGNAQVRSLTNNNLANNEFGQVREHWLFDLTSLDPTYSFELITLIPDQQELLELLNCTTSNAYCQIHAANQTEIIQIQLDPFETSQVFVVSSGNLVYLFSVTNVEWFIANILPTINLR